MPSVKPDGFTPISTDPGVVTFLELNVIQLPPDAGGTEISTEVAVVEAKESFAAGGSADPGECSKTIRCGVSLNSGTALRTISVTGILCTDIPLWISTAPVYVPSLSPCGLTDTAILP